MKKLLVSIIALFLFVHAEAQQTPIYTLYFNNPYLYNPSYAGDGETAQAFVAYRKQWVGIPGAPETQTFTIDGPVKKNVGLGFYFYNDIDNVIGRTGASVAYSYKISIDEDNTLTFGLAAGINQNRIYFDRINVDDDTDPALLNTMNNKSTLDGSFGLNYNRKKLGFGFSAFQLFANNIQFEDQSQFKSVNFKLIRHYIGTLQYTFDLKPDLIELTPKVLVRTAQGLQSQIEGSAILTYKKEHWLGLTYRHESAIILSMATNFYENFYVGYSYELPTTELAKQSSNSHEFMIGYRFGKKSSNPVQTNTQPVVEFNQLSRQNQEQYELIDQLDQRNEKLDKELKEDERLLSQQNEEIERLKDLIAENREARDLMITEHSVDLEGELEEAEPGNYYVVIGAFRKLESAKAYQQIFKRQLSLNSSVIKSTNDWFLIYYKQVKTLKEAVEEVKLLNSKNANGVIVGNVWVYKE